MGTPYVYLIGWTDHNIWYYGSRTAKNCDPSELFVTYFTSSKHVTKFRSEVGDPDIIQIRRIFEDGKICRRWESKVLRRVKAVSNPIWLNKSIGDGSFHTIGQVPARDKETKQSLGMVRLNDPRFLSGEIEGIKTGKAKAYINGVYIGFLSTDDPRWESKEIHGSNKGIKASQSTRDAISVANKGKPKPPVSEETRQKMSISHAHHRGEIPKGYVTVRSLITGDVSRIPKDLFSILNGVLVVSAMFGRSVSQEARDAHSIKMTGRRKTEDEKNKRSAALKGTIVVFDITENRFVQIKTDEYQRNKMVRYFTNSAARVRGFV